MNWTLSDWMLGDWANLAQVLCFPLGIASWLIGRNKVLGICRKLRRAIVFALLLVAAAWCWSFGWLDWTRDVLNWFLRPVTLPVWWLFVGGISAIAAPILMQLIAGWVKNALAAFRQTTPAQQVNQRPRLRVFNVDWTWEGDELSEYSLRPICPAGVSVRPGHA